MAVKVKRKGREYLEMKRVLILILSIVAVFGMLTGCEGKTAQNGGKDDTEIINVSDGQEDGENQDGGLGESDGQEENTEGQGEGNPKYVSAEPIENGGSFNGGQYN